MRRATTPDGKDTVDFKLTHTNIDVKGATHTEEFLCRAIGNAAASMASLPASAKVVVEGHSRVSPTTKRTYIECWLVSEP